MEALTELDLFDCFIYGKRADFRYYNEYDLPKEISTKGLVRVGFILKGDLIYDGDFLTINGRVFEARTLNIVDYADLSFKAKTSVEGVEIWRSYSKISSRQTELDRGWHQPLGL